MLRAEGPAEVLLVALEADVGDAVASVLRRDHYGVSVVNTCESALTRIVDRRPSLMIVCPPAADQKVLDICRQLRFWCAGPLMIVSRECSAGNAEQALAAGADEFFSQPLRTSELLARVRALLRRCGRASAHAEVIRVGDLRVDQARRRVFRDGEEIRLTPTQYSILLFLIENRNRVVSGRMLLERIWGPVRGDYVQTLRVHIGNLRRKIERDPARPRYLVTESRAGYRFVEPEAPFEVSA